LLTADKEFHAKCAIESKSQILANIPKYAAVQVFAQQKQKIDAATKQGI
jgi:hypothetical protein